jgi:glycosyltransferase involved in cell wall biosynthesis
MGQQSNVHAYYAIADVLVLPSHSEGSPNVLLEAMAAQVPIVATAVGGVPEIVQNDETALLIKPNAPEQMAGAISEILGDDALAQRLVRNASAVVATRHTPAHYVESLIRVYQEAINERRSNQP